MQLIAKKETIKVHVVIEIIKHNEGNPGIWVFLSDKKALDHMAQLTKENEGNPDVLVVYEEVEVQ